MIAGVGLIGTEGDAERFTIHFLEAMDHEAQRINRVFCDNRLQLLPMDEGDVEV